MSKLEQEPQQPQQQQSAINESSDQPVNEESSNSNGIGGLALDSPSKTAMGPSPRPETQEVSKTPSQAPTDE